jgi:hypothetical protein
MELHLPNFSAKQRFAGRPTVLTELLRRAAETDPEVASLLCEHPGNADGATLLDRQLGSQNAHLADGLR